MVGAAHRVLEFLETRSDYTWNAKSIAAGTRLGQSTVRVTLRRLVASGDAANPKRGFYQHPSGLIRRSIDPRIRFHGLKFEARCNKTVGWPYRRLHDVVTNRFMDPSYHRINRGVTTRGDWQSRPLTITAHDDTTVLLEVFVQASTLPLTLLELYAFLDGFLPGAFGIPAEFWNVAQADWNIDEIGAIALDFTNLSVGQAKRLILKVYQKTAELVRTEVRGFQKIGAGRLMENAEAILTAMEELSR